MWVLCKTSFFIPCCMLFEYETPSIHTTLSFPCFVLQTFAFSWTILFFILPKFVRESQEQGFHNTVDAFW